MRCSECLERSGQVEAKDLGVGSAFESVILFFFLHLFLFRSCFRVNTRKNLTIPNFPVSVSQVAIPVRFACWFGVIMMLWWFISPQT